MGALTHAGLRYLIISPLKVPTCRCSGQTKVNAGVCDKMRVIAVKLSEWNPSDDVSEFV